jgi:subtilisin family serine protease
MSGRLPIAPFVLSIALGLTSVAGAAPTSTVTSPALRTLPAVAGLAATSPAAAARPVAVVLELDRRLDESTAVELERRGVRFERDARGRVEGGRLLDGRRLVAAEVPPALVTSLEALPGLVRVHADERPMRFPRPVDSTFQTMGAAEVWHLRDELGAIFTGEGLTICDVDSGIDVLHPTFFRDDGGGFDFTDVDGDGALTPGVDTVDLGAGPVVVRHLNGVVGSYYDAAPRFGTEAPAYDPTFDYLYADENGSGAREAGAAAGFTEQTPGYGERLFVPDDADGDGRLDVGERLIALGTSKIKAFRIDNTIYARGVDLVQAPYEPSMSHGSGASTVLVGGQLGRSGQVGVAPDADLVMATDTRGQREVAMTQFCVQQGARVVLHEYAPWVGYHLDGSSPMERLIDTTSADGVVHVNPAGNLSTSKKLFKGQLPAGQTTDLRIELPEIGVRFLYFTLLWRDPSRNLAATLLGPDGTELALPLVPEGGQLAWDPDTTLVAYRDDSPRGTAMATVYLYSTEGNTLVPAGDYTLRLTEPSDPAAGPLALVAYVADEVSGWGLGAHFPVGWSEDHLVGYPGTADRGMAISAFTGNDYDGYVPGERAYYSGRGHRIDGAPLLWIAAPDNPIVAGTLPGRELGYVVYGGTSGASPHVAGASALLLQAFPELDGEGVKDKIREGAVVDAATGDVPNDDFGWGKLQLHRSLRGSDRPAGSPPSFVTTSVTLPLGASTVPLEVDDPDEPASALAIEIDRDYDGRFDETLAAQELAIEADEPGELRVRLRVVDSTGRVGDTLLRIEVVGGVGGDDDAWRGLSIAGGGFCGIGAIGRSHPDGWGFAAFGILAAALTRLARRHR